MSTVVGEVKHALDSPSAAYYAGEKTFDLAAATATAPWGAEGAMVRAGLPAELVTEGRAPLAVMRAWDPVGGMHPSQFEELYGTPEARIYPDNDGFPPGYIPRSVDLEAGTIIDRFGTRYGHYFAPDGAPASDRSLAPESFFGSYERYMATGKPLPSGWEFVEGPVQPFYGQTPSPDANQNLIVDANGTQVRVREAIMEGVLTVDGPPLGR